MNSLWAGPSDEAIFSDSRRILVVVRGGLADAIRVTPFLAQLRCVYRQCEVTVACEPWTEDLLQGCDDLDRLLVLPEGATAGKRSLLARVRGGIALAVLLARNWRRYDLVLIPPYGSRLNTLLGRYLSRRHRVGYGGEGGAGWTVNLGYPDYSVAVERHYRRLFGAVGVNDIALTAKLSYSEEAAHEVATFLARQPWQPPLIALHPGSDWSCQQWAPERWSRLAEALQRRFGGTVVIMGSAAEREPAGTIAAGAQCPTIVAAAELSKLAAAALIARCAFLVSVDSIAPALALATGTPVVVLEAWSKPDWEAWGAPGRFIAVRPASASCGFNERCRAALGRLRSSCHTPQCAGTGGLRETTVERVLHAVERLVLDGRSGGLMISA